MSIEPPEVFTFSAPVGVVDFDVAAGRGEQRVGLRAGHRNVAARGVRIDRAGDVSEGNVAAGGIDLRLAVEIGDADVAARGLQIDVVLRRHVDDEADLEVVVPVEPGSGLVVLRVHADVVAFLREIEVEVVEQIVGFRLAGRPRAADDVDADVAAAGRDLDVAEIGVDDDRAAGADVETAVNRALDRGMSGRNGRQPKHGRERCIANAPHGVPPVRSKYAGQKERLAGRLKRRFHAGRGDAEKELVFSALSAFSA